MNSEARVEVFVSLARGDGTAFGVEPVYTVLDLDDKFVRIDVYDGDGELIDRVYA